MNEDGRSTMRRAARSPGRPRDSDADQRILDAAYRLMAQQGYVRMSMDAVAAEAGVTKPTIYRRWPAKIELALAAIVAACDTSRPTLTGETRADLIGELEHFRRAISRPYGMALLGTVLAEEHEHPELLAAFREYLVAPRRRALRAILNQAVARGELAVTADVGLAVNLLVGAYYAQYLANIPFSEQWSAEVVDTVLAGLYNKK